MPVLKYKARTLSGDIISGNQEAKDEKELAKILLEKNYILVSLGEKAEKKTGEINLSFRKSVSLIDKMMFTRHLGLMVDSGFPFDKSLSVLAEQTKNKNFKKIILELKEDVSRGASFSDTLRKHPKVFNHLYCSMVKVGEETGNLREVLEILAEQMRKDHELISRVKGAMTYPAVIIIVMILIGTLMMIVIIPKFSQLFEDLDVSLPVTTAIIMGIGNFMAEFWYIIPLFFVFLIFAYRTFSRTKKGKRFFDWCSIKLPLIGQLNVKINTARTSRILTSLLRSGVPIVTTLEILSDTLSNSYYKEAINNAVKDIQKGKPLFKSFAPYEKIYTFLLIQMLEVGEETGKLDTILGSLAEFYELEVENITKNLASIIEPVLMVIIGGAVGFFALSIFQPIYSIMGSL
ncbi:MAG: type II secretion system F family protein [Patescibacteria group bacterium]